MESLVEKLADVMIAQKATDAKLAEMMVAQKSQLQSNKSVLMIDSEKLARIKSKTPLKRFLQVEEVYEAVKFLLDEKTSFMTGSEITIDGGYTL